MVQGLLADAEGVNMKVEYICLLTLDERDIRLAAVNGGLSVEHPVPPLKTVITVTKDVRDQLQADHDATLPAGLRGWKASASEPR